MTDHRELTELVAPACESFGVCELSLFGSRARGDSSAESDFDFVVTFDRTQTDKLSYRLFGLLLHLEDHLSGHIDLLEQNANRNPYLRKADAPSEALITPIATRKTHCSSYDHPGG